MSRREAWTYYFACFLPSVCYPLACSFFSKRTLESIQRKSLAILIARCGFNRTTKREIIFGPLELGGANFRHLYHQQGLGQIQLFIKHWRSQTQAGKLLQIALHWFQQAVGISTPILEDVSSPLPHLESKWIKSIREFLASIQATLQLDNPGSLTLQRTHDSFIMEHITRSRKFTASEIQRLNYCRLYLRVTSVADIATIKGDQVDDVTRTGNLPVVYRTIQGPWIHQDKPGESEWKLWRKANLLWSDHDGTLHKPLGRWLLPIHHQRAAHIAYKHNDRICIRRSPGDYQTCQRSTDVSGKWMETTRILKWDQLPALAIPIEIRYDGHDRWTQVAQSYIISPPRAASTATFEDFVASLDPWESDLLQNTELFSDPYSVALCVSHGVRVVSDGSERFGTHGAFGWAMSDDRGERVATGMGPARGALASVNRSEAFGMLAVTRFLIRLGEFTGQVEEWQGILATDSQSVLDTIAHVHTMPEARAPATRTYHTDQWKTLEVLSADWDVLIELQESLKLLPDLALQHVRGHHDNHIPYQQLSLLAQLNVDADHQASTCQRLYGSARPYTFLMPHTKAHIHNKDGTITSHYEAILRHNATRDPLYQHIAARNKWSSAIMRTINWKAHGQVLKQRINRRVHYTKLVHDILPVNANLHRNDCRRRLCSLCKVDDETRDHIIRCPARSRHAWRSKFLRLLDNICREHHTRPDLRHLLLRVVAGGFEQDDYSLPPITCPPALRRVVAQQQVIGWRQMFNGRFSEEWSSLQDDYYATSTQHKDNKRLSGARWQTSIIRLFWDQWDLLWELRNAELHGADTASKEAANRLEVERTLTELYAMKEHLDAPIQRLMRSDEVEHRREPTWVTKNWIAVHGPLIRENMREIQVRARIGMRNIRTYFTRGGG